jgi:hypothetical protein
MSASMYAARVFKRITGTLRGRGRGLTTFGVSPLPGTSNEDDEHTRLK